MVGGFGLDVCGIAHNHGERVGVDPEEGRGKGGHVDETDAVGFAFDEVELDILLVVNQDGIRQWWSKPRVGRIEHALHKRDALLMVPMPLLDGF